MVVEAVTLTVPTSVEELQAALEEIGKEVTKKIEDLNLTDPGEIHELKRDPVSKLVAGIKNAETMAYEDIKTTVMNWWSSQEETTSAS